MFFVEPLRTVRAAHRARAQGDAARPVRARPRGLLPRERLEHRRRGPVPARRDRRRRRGAVRHDARHRGAAWVFVAGRARRPASLGGMAWAAIIALLRDRFNANEILVSLMLVYVARAAPQLSRLRAVEGPAGLQLPADHDLRRGDAAAATWSPASRLHVGFAIALVLVAVFWVVHVPDLARLPAPGRRARAGGRALRRVLGARRALWTALLVSGGLAGAGRRDRGGRAAAASSRRTSRPATASRRSSSPSSAGCTRSAASSPACCCRMFLHRRRARRSRGSGCPTPLTGVFQGAAAVLAARLRHADPLPAALAPRAPSPDDGARHERDRAPGRRHARRRARRCALAGLGLLINERAGVLNLGAEGMMLVAAIAGFAAAFHTGNDWIAFAAGGRRRGARSRPASAWLVIWLNTNQYATGLALSLFGVGLLGVRGHRLRRQEARRAAPASRCPVLADIPFLGPALFRQHPMVYVAIAARRRAGLVPLPHARRAWCCARSASRPSRRTRSATRCAGSASPRSWSAARCAASPAPTSRSSTRRCGSRGMVAGRGWIALALTTVRDLAPGARAARRVPLRRRDDAAVPPAGRRACRSPSQFLTMLPYLATIVVLVADLAQPGVDPRQHAGLARQAVLSRCLTVTPHHRTKSIVSREIHPEQAFLAEGPSSLAADAAALAGRLRQGRAARRPRPPRPPPAPGAAPPAEPLKVAFVYVGPVGDAGWTFAHDQGRKAVEAEFGDKIKTTLRREGARGRRRRARHPRPGRARATS